MILIRLCLTTALAWILLVLEFWLVLNGYADAAAGIMALVVTTAGIWLSAKGMARLKLADNLLAADLENAYRYRNAGVALGVIGSGLLIFSWEAFLNRFINSPNGRHLGSCRR